MNSHNLFRGPTVRTAIAATQATGIRRPARKTVLKKFSLTVQIRVVQGAGPENDGPRVQNWVVQRAGLEGDSAKVQKTVLEADRVEGNGSGGDRAGPEAGRVEVNGGD